MGGEWEPAPACPLFGNPAAKIGLIFVLNSVFKTPSFKK
jgi:hypothetical protein